MLKILIAGLGSIGRRHLRNLVALGERDVVLLRSHRSTLPDEEIGEFPVETDIGEALRKHKPAAVIIANPTALHLDVAIPAAAAGCHLLLEKPISHSLDRVGELQRAVERTGVKVMVGFQLRFHPCLIRARQWLHERRIGRLLSARVQFGEYLPAWHPWEDYRKGYAARADLGGGVLLTQCHSLDYLPWLVGEIDSIWGYLGKLSDLELDVEDSAEIAVRFASGAIGSLHIDYAQQPPSHRVEISGTEGSLYCDLVAGTCRVYDARAKAWEDYSLPPAWERNVMFLDEMKGFLEAVKEGVAPPCTLDDGVRVMRLIAAVRTSNESGQRISLRS